MACCFFMTMRITEGLAGCLSEFCTVNSDGKYHLLPREYVEDFLRRKENQ